MSPTPIHVRWRHVAPDDRGGFHARKLTEHQLPKTQRRRIVASVTVGERHELSAGRERVGDGAHDAILQRRHHVSPRETADDAARGLWRNVVGEMFGGIKMDVALREAMFEHLHISRAQFQRQQATARTHSLQ